MAAIEIFKAEPMDACNILRLLKESHEESVIPYPPVVDGDALMHIVGTINLGYALVAKVSGRIVGAMGVRPQRFWWNQSAQYGADSFFYIQPKFRKGGSAAAFIRALKRFSDDTKTPLITGMMFGKDAELKDRFCEIMGLTYAGGMFCYGFQALTTEVNDEPV